MRVGVWVLGSDRPGIVAAITGAIAERGANLADTAMTILSGQFAMVLIVDGVDDLSAFTAAVHDAGACCSVMTQVAALSATHDDGDDGEAYIVSVHGADRPGIVHAIATTLADASANIIDVRTHVVGDDAEPVYTMLLEVVVPESSDVDALRAALRECAHELGVEAHMHPVDADVL